MPPPTPGNESSQQSATSGQVPAVTDPADEKNLQATIPAQWIAYAKFSWKYVLKPFWFITVWWPFWLIRVITMTKQDRMLRELKAMRKMMADDQRQKQSIESDQKS